MADFKAVQRILSKFPVFKALSNTLNQDNIDQILPDLDSDSYVESALFYIALILLVISCLVVLSKSGFFLIKLKIRTPAGGNYIELPDRVVVDDARRSSLTQSNPVCAFKVWRKQPAGQDKEPISGYIGLRNSVCQHLNYCVLCYCDCPGLSSYQDLHFKKIRQRSLDWAELCKIGKKMINSILLLALINLVSGSYYNTLQKILQTLSTTEGILFERSDINNTLLTAVMKSLLFNISGFVLFFILISIVLIQIFRRMRAIEGRLPASSV